MSRKLNGWLAALLVVALVAITGCADTAQQEAEAAATARQEAWNELEQQKEQLEAARQELAEARAALDEAEGEAPAETDGAEGEAGETVEDLQARVAQLEARVTGETEDFYSALVAFINEEPMIEGEEPTELQLAALRMKSGEDMLVAQEYIDKGGNYRRAIDIYSSALAVDPENPELQAALEEAEAKRYMSEERFAQVEEGMTADEVRDVLGTPFHANVREYDEGVISWFYPTDPQGSAAAVWFRDRNGDLTVYKTDYKQVVKEGPTEAGGEDDEPAAG